MQVLSSVFFFLTGLSNHQPVISMSLRMFESFVPLILHKLHSVITGIWLSIQEINKGMLHTVLQTAEDKLGIPTAILRSDDHIYCSASMLSDV